VSEDREKYGSGLTLDANHIYRLDGVVLPSVTQILQAVLNIQYWATEWHLERGHVVHQCAAMIARGEEFEHDPQIDGQVAACRRFFRETSAVAELVEAPGFDARLWYAGALDMVCKIGGRRILVDWKARITPVVQWQLGAYAGLLGDPFLWGAGVELHEDGTYKMGVAHELKRASREFANIRSVYGMMERENLLPKKEGVE
jgi:hypothetical protein